MNMARQRRNYPRNTQRVLDIQSLNQCAYPKCTNTLVEPSAGESGPVVTGEICHIHALNPGGPRWKEGLSPAELNSPENLIMLCPTHHAVVDGQPEFYTAEILQQWKRDHETKVKSQHPAGLDFFTEIIDRKIKDETDIFRKSRFFSEFDSIRYSLALARKLVKGELSCGTDSARRESLAWCARLLSRTEKLDDAETYLSIAKKLGTCPEIAIADAFISSQKGNKQTALGTLAKIDSPMSRSAALVIVAHHDGPQKAIDWLSAAGIDATHLDSDGKLVLLNHQLELADWEVAQNNLDMLTDDDFQDTPALHHVTAMTHLMGTVPEEFRSPVLQRLHLPAAHFPLASDATAMEARRIAHRHFLDATKVARELGCPHAEKIYDEYALWLELKDPDKCNEGRIRLESELRDPKNALCFVRLGVEFGVKLDLHAVEREIERQTALNGGMTLDAALARFALAFKQETPEHVANYITRYYDELAQYLNKELLQSCRIEMLAKAGLPKKAIECLDDLVEEGLSEAKRSFLKRRIDQAEGTSPVESLKEQFKETDSLSDLENLVYELENRENWDDLCEYGKILFERTHALRDAERLAIALYNAKKNERILEFLKSNKTFLTQSKRLHMLYCWSLYYDGALLEARSELAKLDGDWNDPHYRELQIGLGISSGDWRSLSIFVMEEYTEKDKRSAQELLRSAQLAFNLDSPYAKELIFAAAKKGENDADILASAYFLATKVRVKDDPNVSQWLHKAIDLSGDDGPIQRMTLKDVWNRRPEWEQRVSEISQQSTRGEIPMSLAGHALNKSLLDLMLFPALANLSERDPRRRGVIPAYSGKRQPASLNIDGQVGMDATALLTLSFLNLLDETLDALDTVHIPHSTLGWLFEEKQKAAFHQPSRIKDAHQVRNLLATDALEKLSPGTVPDSDLSNQIGDELATLIAEAEKVRDHDNTQRLVVRSFPVHRVASLMEEEADLTTHATVLSSCQSIVDRLRQKGQITVEEERKARAYLQLHEKPWPNQPQIADGAILYLDGLAIDYFLDLGILEKLRDAGFRPIVSPGKVAETNQLISYESISGKIEEAIERIRSALTSRIESGKIKVGRRTNPDQSTERPIPQDPTIDVVALAKHCDAIITDDRFLNRHLNVDNNGVLTPVFSTLDFIDILFSTGSKTAEERMKYRTRLRQAGYFFMPVSEDELAHHLNASTVEEGRVCETAELKAIRENILHVRMSPWLQFPEEIPWLKTLQEVFIRVLKNLWRADANFPHARTRSDWIMEQIDIRGWIHIFGRETGVNILKTGHAAYILMLLMPPDKVSREVEDKYWNWVEERVLGPIKERHPDLYSLIVENQRKLIAEMADKDVRERNDE